MKCKKCDKELTEQEIVTYSGRCEDCWAYSGSIRDLSQHSSASKYSSAPTGDPTMISNNATFKRDRMK